MRIDHFIADEKMKKNIERTKWMKKCKVIKMDENYYLTYPTRNITTTKEEKWS